MFLGNFLNLLGILLGTFLGFGLKNFIGEELRSGTIVACGLVVGALSFSMILKADNAIIVLFSMVAGTIIGELLDIDKRMNDLGKRAEEFLMKKSNSGRFSAAFVYATILFCTGAMGIMGSLESGLTGGYSILASKAIIDMVLAGALTITMGIGVMGSAFTTFIYQGIIILAAESLSPFLTEDKINIITCVGGLLVLSISFNLLGIKKFKTANMLPAVFLAPVLIGFFG